jgi:hypothetical protein
MTPEAVGWLGGILGAAIGLLGGVAGTYFTIKNARGPRERAFVIRAAIVSWVLVLAFLGAMLILPSPLRYWLWLPCGILLPLGVLWWNRRQSRIRREESGGPA